jgi:hypothetical protein
LVGLKPCSGQMAIRDLFCLATRGKAERGITQALYTHLGLDKEAQGLNSPLAAHTGVLHAPKGGAQIPHEPGVDPYYTAFESLSNAVIRPRLRVLFRIRRIESVNNLLPVAALAGEFLRAWLLRALAQILGASAGASVIGDMTVGIASQCVFTILGIVLLLRIGALLLDGRDPQFLSHPDQLRQRLGLHLRSHRSRH